jgi:hypothetical protein
VAFPATVPDRPLRPSGRPDVAATEGRQGDDAALVGRRCDSANPSRRRRVTAHGPATATVTPP